MTDYQSRADRRLSALLFPSFFLSGAVGLVYQILWTRQLSLVFGVTIQAASTVLASFMAGLALGSYLAGRWSDTLHRPLRAFALVEATIAASALVTPMLLTVADRLFVDIAVPLDRPALVNAIARIFLTSSVLIIPATLMGMTYPLVLRTASRGADGIRRMAALLYAVNTSGAIVGVLFGSLWLIPTMGLRRTFWIAAGMNGLVALVAGLASLFEPPLPPATTSAPPSPVGTVLTRPVSSRARTVVILVMALSGTVSLALELVWFRILVFFLRPTTYAFASMLAAVLAGLAIGSYAVTPWLRRRANWLAVLGAMEIAIGLAAVLSAFALVRAHDVMVWMFSRFEALNPPYDFVLPLLFAAAFAILPTAILLGAAFPIGLILWTTGEGLDDSQVGRRVGGVYALNVGGAIVGSLAGGFLLIPSLGAQSSLIVISAIPMIGGSALFWMAHSRRRLPVIAGALAVFLGASLTFPDVFQDVIRARYPGHHVLWHAEDAQATVSVVRHNQERILLIDGMHHASDGGPMSRYHRGIGALAVAVHPDPRHVLIVGMGGGTTAGGAAILPNTSTTVVELSRSVVQATSWFANINRNILSNPNVTVNVTDGRQYLKLTTQKFDVITADLMLPHLAGAASLYSVDYYRLAREALAPGGIMVQWIPADTQFQHKLMLRSFLAAFPHVSMWMGGDILIGSNHPLQLKESDFLLKVAYPQVQLALAESGLPTFEVLTQQYFTNRSQLEKYAGLGPMLEDDRPIVEYFLSMPTDSPPVDLTPYRSRAEDVVVGTRGLR